MRQKEDEKISKVWQAILGLGGANNNNTDKLFDICSKNCLNTFRIVSTNEFDYEKIKSFNKVGIIMGASTPIQQFQEVIQNMEKVTTEDCIPYWDYDAPAGADTPLRIALVPRYQIPGKGHRSHRLRLHDSQRKLFSSLSISSFFAFFQVFGIIWVVSRDKHHKRI
jgi:hypothetical protein